MLEAIEGAIAVDGPTSAAPKLRYHPHRRIESGAAAQLACGTQSVYAVPRTFREHSSICGRTGAEERKLRHIDFADRQMTRARPERRL